MDAKYLIKKMVNNRFQRNFVLPNYTPPYWWECDVFEITPKGYFVEYEIKISRNDFLADAKKSRKIRYKEKEYVKNENLIGKSGPLCLFENKHELIKQKKPYAPNRFYFATPKGLLKKEEIPEWAGLIEISEKGWETRIQYAPWLHKEKYQHKHHAEKICYWRMHRLMQSN